MREKALQALHDENERLGLNKDAYAHQKQEPFGYFKAEPFGWTDCAETDEGARALYETPQQRPWVGLTDEEVIEISHLALTRVQAVLMTTAKLREKNG